MQAVFSATSGRRGRREAAGWAHLDDAAVFTPELAAQPDRYAVAASLVERERGEFVRHDRVQLDGVFGLAQDVAPAELVAVRALSSGHALECKPFAPDPALLGAGIVTERARGDDEVGGRLQTRRKGHASEHSSVPAVRSAL